jgi:hypothetical protein
LNYKRIKRHKSYFYKSYFSIKFHSFVSQILACASTTEVSPVYPSLPSLPQFTPVYPSLPQFTPRPRGDLGETSGRPRGDLGETSGRPRGDLGETSGRARIRINTIFIIYKKLTINFLHFNRPS